MDHQPRTRLFRDFPWAGLAGASGVLGYIALKLVLALRRSAAPAGAYLILLGGYVGLIAISALIVWRRQCRARLEARARTKPLNLA